MRWALSLQWSSVIDPSDCYVSSDPSGVLVGLIDGQIIGSISAVRYSPNVGFIGFFIVEEEWRGKGYGKKLFETAMEYMEGRVVGLDAVVERVITYEKSGFNLARWTLRHKGTFQQLQSDYMQDVQIVKTVTSKQIADLDVEVTGFERPLAYFQAFLANPQLQSWVALQGGQVKGLIVLKQSPCQTYYFAAPWYARSTQVAKALFATVLTLGQLEGRTLYVDVPFDNTEAIHFVRQLGFEESFRCARMWRGETRPKENTELLYGSWSFEMG
jgi:ribosomal protein S18 acetylase RimI-like enzyme